MPHRCLISLKIWDIYGTYMGHIWDILLLTTGFPIIRH
jgi:hypothetical protein